MSIPPPSVAAPKALPMAAVTRAGERAKLAGVAAVLLVVTLWVYAPARTFEYIAFDDADYVTDNRMVQAGLTARSIAWAFTTGHASNWHPLTWLSHMVDAELFGASAAGPHGINVVLHVANSLILLVVLRAFTGSIWRSGCVAALFALHPLHVESVAWVAERKDVLSAFFFLLTLWAYARYAQAGDVAASVPACRNDGNDVSGPRRLPLRRRFFSRWYVIALLLFACALMSKPMVVTLPCVLLLLDYWPLQRWTSNRAWDLGRLAVEKIPFFVLTVLSSAITFVVQRRGGAVESLDALSFGDRIANAAVSYARYLGKTFWPTDLAIFYPYPASWPWLSVAGAVALIGVLVVGMWRLGRRWPFVPVGLLWFLGMLVPTLGIVQVGMQAMADRYTYLPSIGLFVVVAWAGAAALRERVGAPLIGAIVFALLIACTAVTSRQLSYWRDDERLFGRALAVTEGNFVAHNSLGHALRAQGRDADAARHFLRAIEIRPDFADAHNNLGSAVLDQGGVDAAIRHFREAVAQRPEFALARYNLGTALLQIGRSEEAIVELQRAAELRPEDELIHLNLGNARLQRGESEQALGHYRRVLDLMPGHADALNNSGSAFLQQGRVEQAIAAFRAALESQPTHANAHFNLGDVYLRSGRPPEAVIHFERAAALAPQDGEAREFLQLARRQLESSALSVPAPKPHE